MTDQEQGQMQRDALERCMTCDEPPAAQIRHEIIQTFMAWKAGRKPPKPQSDGLLPPNCCRGHSETVV